MRAKTKWNKKLVGWVSRGSPDGVVGIDPMGMIIVSVISHWLWPDVFSSAKYWPFRALTLLTLCLCPRAFVGYSKSTGTKSPTWSLVWLGNPRGGLTKTVDLLCQKLFYLFDVVSLSQIFLSLVKQFLHLYFIRFNDVSVFSCDSGSIHRSRRR